MANLCLLGMMRRGVFRVCFVFVFVFFDLNGTINCQLGMGRNQRTTWSRQVVCPAMANVNASLPVPAGDVGRYLTTASERTSACLCKDGGEGLGNCMN